MTILAHKIVLQPTALQEVHFRKAAGTQRFAYNWALARWKSLYQEDIASGCKPRQYANIIQKELDATKRDLFPWMLEVSKGVPQGGIQNLNSAFQRFFKKLTKYPKFKSKHRCKDSFRADGNTTPEKSIRFSGRYIKIPKLDSYIRMTEKLRFSGKLQRVTFVKEGPRWFAVFVVDTNDKQTIVRENQTAVGIDLGINHLAVTSEGEVFDNPKPLRKNLVKLARAQRIMSRRVKGSNRRLKAVDRIRKLHFRVGNLRKNSLHQITSYLAKRYDVIGVEDLNVKGMMRNHKLALSLSDVAFGEFRRQLEYKSVLYGSQVVVIDRFFPSSKTCSSCGYKLNTLSLKVRDWECVKCGAVHDRDHNAALNIRAEALATLKSRGSDARGDLTAVSEHKLGHKSGRGSVKSTFSAPEGAIGVL